MRIAVIGAGGVLGRHVVPRLIERGHRVTAVCRTAARRSRLEALATACLCGDILDAASLVPTIEGADAVINLATAIPAPRSDATWAMNDRIRRAGTANLIAAARQAGVARIVQQSVALVHAGNGDALVTERSPRHPGPVTASAIDMEDMLFASGLDVRIARGGTFYGPGTARMPAWAAEAAAGTLRLPGDGSGWLSLIRVEDMASACVELAETAGLSGPFLVVNSEPLTWAELFAHLAAVAGTAPPRAGGPALLPGLRASNAALLVATPWRPAYASWRSGLA